VQLGIGERIKIMVTGSAVFNRRYIFEQLHFHWGSRNNIGSEHVINGKHYPMEVHFVHYNEKYGSFDDAVDKSDGLLVLSGLYRVKNQLNKLTYFVIYIN
jgi:carbonic anhydrase